MNASFKGRIFKNAYYLIGDTPGISGHQQWDKMDLRLVTGHRIASRGKVNVIRQFNPQEPVQGNVWLEDGHLPGHQPDVSIADAIKWLYQNPFQAVYIGQYPADNAKAIQNGPLPAPVPYPAPQYQPQF